MLTFILAKQNSKGKKCSFFNDEYTLHLVRLTFEVTL